MHGSRGAFSLSSLGAAVGVAVCGIAATSFALALHEVGHGLAAYALGGRFLGFFVSPTAAFADTASSDATWPWVWAAGTPVNLVTGLVAYAALRRQFRPTIAGISLWHFTHLSLVFQLTYVGLLPLGMWLSGQAPLGDWSLVFAEVGINPMVSAAVFLPLAVIAAAALARVSVRLTPWRDTAQFRWGIVAAYVTLVAPPLLLTIAYALVTLPWSGPRDHFEFVGLLITPATVGLVGAVIAQYRHGAEAGRFDEEQVRPSGAGIFPATAVVLLTAALVGVGWLFGPTTVLRRGVAVQRPAPDDYFRGAQDLRVTVAFAKAGRATLFLSSEPVTIRGSRYVRQLSQHLAALGPSRQAAAEFTEFLAEANLSLAKASVSAAPHSFEKGWRWSATADTGSNQIRVQIWPTIYTDHARVVELSLTGVALPADAAAVEGVTTTNGAIVWRRPATFVAPVQFDVEIAMTGR